MPRLLTTGNVSYTLKFFLEHLNRIVSTSKKYLCGRLGNYLPSQLAHSHELRPWRHSRKPQKEQRDVTPKFRNNISSKVPAISISIYDSASAVSILRMTDVRFACLGLVAMDLLKYSQSLDKTLKSSFDSARSANSMTPRSPALAVSKTSSSS